MLENVHCYSKKNRKMAHLIPKLLEKVSPLTEMSHHQYMADVPSIILQKRKCSISQLCLFQRHY